MPIPRENFTISPAPPLPSNLISFALFKFTVVRTMPVSSSPPVPPSPEIEILPLILLRSENSICDP